VFRKSDSYLTICFSESSGIFAFSFLVCAIPEGINRRKEAKNRNEKENFAFTASPDQPDSRTIDFLESCCYDFYLLNQHEMQ